MIWNLQSTNTIFDTHHKSKQWEFRQRHLEDQIEKSRAYGRRGRISRYLIKSLRFRQKPIEYRRGKLDMAENQLFNHFRRWVFFGVRGQFKTPHAWTLKRTQLQKEPLLSIRLPLVQVAHTRAHKSFLKCPRQFTALQLPLSIFRAIHRVLYLNRRFTEMFACFFDQNLNVYFVLFATCELHVSPNSDCSFLFVNWTVQNAIRANLNCCSNWEESTRVFAGQCTNNNRSLFLNCFAEVVGDQLEFLRQTSSSVEQCGSTWTVHAPLPQQWRPAFLWTGAANSQLSLTIVAPIDWVVLRSSTPSMMCN